MTYSFYDTNTGLLSGCTYAGPADVLAQNTPPGYAAISGAYDHLAQKVDIATGAIVDYRPAAPADTADNAWTWVEQTKRWQAVPTLAALKHAGIATIQAAIDAQERLQDRPQRELMAAFRQGQPPPAFASSKMAGIDAEIVRLRACRAAVVEAQSQAELVALLRP